MTNTTTDDRTLPLDLAKRLQETGCWEGRESFPADRCELPGNGTVIFLPTLHDLIDALSKRVGGAIIYMDFPTLLREKSHFSMRLPTRMDSYSAPTLIEAVGRCLVAVMEGEGS